MRFGTPWKMEPSGAPPAPCPVLVAVNRLKEIMVLKGFQRAGGEASDPARHYRREPVASRPRSLRGGPLLHDRRGGAATLGVPRLPPRTRGRLCRAVRPARRTSVPRARGRGIAALPALPHACPPPDSRAGNGGGIPRGLAEGTHLLRNRQGAHGGDPHLRGGRGRGRVPRRGDGAGEARPVPPPVDRRVRGGLLVLARSGLRGAGRARAGPPQPGRLPRLCPPAGAELPPRQRPPRPGVRRRRCPAHRGDYGLRGRRPADGQAQVRASGHPGPRQGAGSGPRPAEGRAASRHRRPGNGEVGARAHSRAASSRGSGRLPVPGLQSPSRSGEWPVVR